MAVDDLARADPLPRVIAWLANHTAVTAELGGAGRVGMRNEPPYPRLRITDPPGGDDRTLRWLIAKNVQIEAYEDLSGGTGKAQLHRILYVALGALMELPDQQAPAEGPVITYVQSTSAAGWSPEPTGQGRYVSSVLIWAHPAPA